MTVNIWSESDVVAAIECLIIKLQHWRAFAAYLCLEAAPVLEFYLLTYAGWEPLENQCTVPPPLDGAGWGTGAFAGACGISA